jgi:hypothetical protein
VIIEVGLAQSWDGCTGHDRKALRWYNARKETRVEYILCVKIEKIDGVVSTVQIVLMFKL